MLILVKNMIGIDFQYLETLEAILNHLTYMQIKIIPMKQRQYSTLAMIASWVVFISALQKEWINSVLISVILGYHFSLSKSDFVNEVNSFNSRNKLAAQIKQQNNLLMHLLPKHIIFEFFNNPSKRLELIDIFDEVTILFADIAGFTAYSSDREPEEVVHMLRNLFTDFDKCCLVHDVYKLYTIGDCYVILGLVDAVKRNPA